MLELLRFGPGGATTGQRLASANLEEAIRLARDLIADDDQMSIVEVRDNGETLSTVGRGWTSRLCARQSDSGLT